MFFSNFSKQNFLYSLIGLMLTTFVACTNTATNSGSENEESVSFSDETTQKIYNITDKRIQDPARARKELMVYLRNEEAMYRVLAAQGLANLADTATATVDTLAKAFVKEKSAQVRQALAYTLGTSANPKAATVLAAAFPKETDMGVRAAILEAVGKTGNLAMLTFIANVKTYEPKDSVLLEAQARSLFRFAQRNIVSGEGTKTMLDFVMGRTAPRKARIQAAYYFGRTKMVSVAAHEDSLSKVILTEPEPQVRMFMASALARTKGKKALDALNALMAKETDARVKVRLVSVLGPNFGAKLAYAPLLAAVDDPNVAVAATAAEQLKTFGMPKDVQLYLDKATAEKRWQVSTALYAAALSHTTLKFKPKLEEISATLLERYKASKNDYEKTALLHAMTGYGMNYNFIKSEVINTNTALPLRTAGIEAIAKIRKSPTFRFTFGKSVGAIVGSIDTVMQDAIKSGDAGMVVSAAEALRDSSLGFKSTIPITVLEDGLKRVQKNLPGDLEAFNSLLQTINYFKSQPLNSNEEKSRYNHSIDWQALGEHNSGATITTTKGVIEIKFMAKEAPGSVCNFVKLAGADFYNGKFFHRVVPGFVVQGGCPRGDGYGAQNFTIRTETPVNTGFDDAGWVGMASSGKDTEGVQWFITTAAAPHLDGKYTIFAKVTKGFDVLQKLEVGDKMTSVKVR
jgi:cyclophilin family peptidyl-prolyl cis-trans isomerase/HEAT repeat protein